MTNTEAYEAILRHHALLSEQVQGRAQAVRRAINQVPGRSEGRGYEPAVAELVAFLADEVLPHASAEEQTIYPVAAAHAELTEVVEQMVAEHERLVSLTKELASARSGIPASAISWEIAELFVAHVGRENGLLLPPLVADKYVDLADLLLRMRELLTASKGTGFEHDSKSTSTRQVSTR
jgi:iron-sulfur cluster repair protein YtfE (RIC family)